MPSVKVLSSGTPWPNLHVHFNCSAGHLLENYILGGVTAVMPAPLFLPISSKLLLRCLEAYSSHSVFKHPDYCNIFSPSQSDFETDRFTEIDPLNDVSKHIYIHRGLSDRNLGSHKDDPWWLTQTQIFVWPKKQGQLKTKPTKSSLLHHHLQMKLAIQASYSNPTLAEHLSLRWLPTWPPGSSCFSGNHRRRVERYHVYMYECICHYTITSYTSLEIFPSTCWSPSAKVW